MPQLSATPSIICSYLFDPYNPMDVVFSTIPNCHSRGNTEKGKTLCTAHATLHMMWYLDSRI